MAKAAVVWLGASCAMPGVAQPTPPSSNLVSLSARATVEVSKDWLTLVFAVTRDGPDAAAVQSQLKAALDAALGEARKGARPGQLEVHTGAFSLHPRYAPPTVRIAGQPGGIVGWQGTAELVIEGRDTQAIASLSARISTMNVARVGFSLSREAREKVEAEVTMQAIARFRARAEAITREFGMNSHQLREISVSTDDQPPPPARPMMQLQASRSVAEEALPVEAGKALVTATVSGSVQMLK